MKLWKFLIVQVGNKKNTFFKQQTLDYWKFYFSLFGFKRGEDVRKYISSENLGVAEPYNEAKEERGFRQVVLNDAPVKNGAFNTP